MHTVIVLSRPVPTSFNTALADVADQTLGDLAHTVEISDLRQSEYSH